MATSTHNINIVVSAKGTVAVKREIDSIGAASRKTGIGVEALKGLLAGLAGAFTFDAYKRFSDAFTTISNKLKLVTNSTEAHTKAMETTAAIARESRTTWDAVANTYQKVKQAQDNLGLSSQGVTDLTRTLSLAMTASGASAEDASGALYQLSQAFSSGVLQGEEFKVIAERMPYLLDIIAKGTGKPRGALKALGSEGLLTAKMLADAFTRMRKTIESDAAGMAPTISSAFTVVSNSLIGATGAFNQTSGAAGALARAILFVGDNMNTIFPVIVALSGLLLLIAGVYGFGLVLSAMIAMTTYLVATLIPALISVSITILTTVIGAFASLANAALTTVLPALVRMATTITTVVIPALARMALVALANPYVWLAAAIALIVYGLYDWISSNEEVAANIAASGDLIGGIYTMIVGWIDSAIAKTNEWAGNVQEGLSAAWDYLKGKVEPVTDFIQAAIQKIIDVVSGLISTVATSLVEAFQTAKNLILTALQPVINFLKRVWDMIKFIVAALQSIGRSVGIEAPSAADTAAPGGASPAAGFDKGGAFKVGGSGSGRDKTPVSFMANRGERATIETKKQQRDNDNARQPANTDVKVGITNVIDPNMIPQALETAKGGRSVVNVIKANSQEIKSALGLY